MFDLRFLAIFHRHRIHAWQMHRGWLGHRIYPSQNMELKPEGPGTQSQICDFTRSTKPLAAVNPAMGITGLYSSSGGRTIRDSSRKVGIYNHHECLPDRIRWGNRPEFTEQTSYHRACFIPGTCAHLRT